ncbi:MAG: 50S ribosomal protein L1 [Chloroflexota bacterium]|nr:MAG: 50S ribosomal protein L1 [Chloroflexota bacterium]
MPKRGKKYQEVVKLVDPAQNYTPAEAVDLVKKTSYTKFNATVEAHLRMGLDPRKADQLIRSTVQLPHGTGREVRVLVFAEGEGQKAALDAGADYAGSDDIVTKIQGGWFDFDVAVATPGMMSKVGRLGKVLGPRGLMPSPKAGTVVPDADVSRVVRELKAGRLEFKLDRTANVHLPIGKVSFTNEQLVNNFAALMEAIQQVKPAAAKGVYIKKITLNATMGPGIKVDAAQASQLKSE